MKKLLRLLFRIFLLLVIVIAGIVVIKTAGVSSRQTDIDTIPAVDVSEKATERFSKAIQIPTISEEGQFDSTTFLQLDTLIRTNFPLVDSLLERINITPLSLTFKWPGKNPDLLPVLLMGHADVVPVEENTEQEWEAGPFSGAVKDRVSSGAGELSTIRFPFSEYWSLLNSFYQKDIFPDAASTWLLAMTKKRAEKQEQKR